MRGNPGCGFLVAVYQDTAALIGKWLGRVEASGETREAGYAPAGFARGFGVRADSADITIIKVREYIPAREATPAFDE